MTIDVTVLSAWHNRADGVAHSIASLAAQDCDSFHAIVVDDASSDDTYERLRAFASDRIEVRRQANLGFTATMIALCREATTEFVALHGAGDESLPHRLAAQRDFLRAHPNVVAVGCGLENVDEVSGRRWQVRPQATIRPGPIAGDFGISHGEIMFRREAYLRAGGYRALFTVGQASDLFRRMSRLGDFGYVDDILYRRYLRLDGVSAKIEKVAERTILAAISGTVHANAVSAPPAAQLRDELDRHGLLLPYLIAPDRRIARALASASSLFWSAGNRPLAIRLARRSLGERWTARGWIALASALVGTGALRRPVAAITARLSRGEGEFARDRLAGNP